MNKTKAVVFDMDGVIFDTQKQYNACFREMGTLAVRMAPRPRRRAPMDSTAGEKRREVWTAPVSTPIINWVEELHARATGVPSSGLAASMGGELLS